MWASILNSLAQRPAMSPAGSGWKNLNNLMHDQLADAGINPTHWQASTFPEPFRQRISVIHDGIDTNLLKPNSSG